MTTGLCKYAKLTLLTVPYRNTAYRTEYWTKTVELTSTALNRSVQFWRNLAVWLQFRPKTIVFLQQLFMYKTLIVNQELRAASNLRVSMQATAGPFPQADAAPAQPQGRSWKHCVASAHGRSTPGSENGRFWGGEAIMRPFLHRQCQLGTVPYTVPYFTV